MRGDTRAIHSGDPLCRSTHPLLHLSIREMRITPHIPALRDDTPRLHDDDAIRKTACKRNVVRDEEEGDPLPLRQEVQVLRDHLPYVRIEPLRRLIGENPRRLACVRHRAEHALQHAARELVGIGVQDTLRIVEPEPREELRVCRLIPGRTPCPAAHIRHLPPDPMHGAECRTRQLRDDPPLFAPVSCTQFCRRARGNIHIAEQDFPADRRPLRQRPVERLPER